MMKKLFHKYNLFPAMLSAFIFLCVMLYFWIGLLLFLTGCSYHEADDLKASLVESTQESIADKVLRLHIVADSNSELDQQIKLEVKDAVVTYLEPYLADITTKEAAKEAIESHLDDLSALAAEILAEKNFPYSATASLGISYFPVKTYGDLTLPAGNYDALEIRLGNAAGKNWWCLVFPQLCFVDITYGTLPEESKENLREILSEEEYRLVLGEEKLPSLKSTPRIRFRLLEWIRDLF